MEKAKLLLTVSKKKQITATLQFESGKTIPLQRHNLRDTKLNGSEVEVERDKEGRVVLVKAESKVLFSAQPSKEFPQSKRRFEHATSPKSASQEKRPARPSSEPASPAQNRQFEHVSYVRNPAYAPYNFVPLNREVVEINPTIPPANKYDPQRNTGWIDLDIEAITPLYIRGTLTMKEVETGDKETKDKPDFCAPVDKLRIPGSSLRGLTRNMVEIVSFGRFHFFEDRRLYYRGLADRSNLREEYQSRMSSYDRRARRAQYNFSVGLLLKSGKKEPGLHFEIKSSGGNFRQIYKDEAQDMVQAIGGKYAEFNFYRVNEGYLVVSGDMPNKKRDWLISEPPDNAEIIEIPPEDVRSYNDDRTRDERVPNLLELARQKENEKGVPCFYVRWQDASGKDRVSFGHTGMFRLAYEKNIGDHVVTVSHRIDDQTLQKLQDELPEISFIKLQQFKNKEFTESELANILDREKLKKNEIGKILQACAKIDFAEAIFGNEKTHSGRVFFEDAFLIDEQGDPQLEAQTPQILSAPKPTTFQHYLVQNSDEVKQLNHYNSNTIIRGYKIYWHKSGERERWVEKDRKVIERNPKQYTEIKPVKAGTKFRGRIRFENLSDKELGALLFALDLPEGCGHKLGMGKPLGLGSVRITPKLYLSKRAQRYKDFFAEVWDNKIEASALETLKKFKDAFSKYVLQKLGEDSSKLLWETGRLRELLVMLRFDVGRELERTGANRYMTIAPQNEFKNRYVLPKATGLVSISKLEEALAQLKSETVIAKEKITHIKKIEITGLWDKFNLKWQLDQDASILVGINGSGKTTILELITHALAGEYEDSDKVKYPPQEFIIFFNNGEQLKYRRRELMAKPSFRLLPEFISTFDIILDKADRDGTSKAGAQIGRQLTEKLMERIARFYFELKLLPAEFDPKPCIDDFIGIVKKVFHQTKKQIELAGEFVIRQSDGQILMPDQLSAGEKQILIIMLTALILKLRSVANADQRYLLIMDEPENSLHLRWQKLLIGYVRRLNENTQIIIATHAPAIIKKGWLKNTTEMNQIKSAMGA